MDVAAARRLSVGNAQVRCGHRVHTRSAEPSGHHKIVGLIWSIFLFTGLAKGLIISLMPTFRIPRPITLVSAVLVGGVLGMPVLAAAELPVASNPVPERRTLGAFSDGLDNWDVVRDAAHGVDSLTQVATGHDGGGAQLTVDFTAGGSSVALKHALNTRPRELRCWVKPQGVDAVEVRLTDSSGQAFLYSVPLSGSDWQEVVVVPGTTSEASHSGGANTGRWMWSGKEIQLVLRKAHCQAATATLLVDDVTMLADAWVPPRALPTNAPHPPADSIFGFSSHMIHSDLFFDHMAPYWRMEYILPLVVDGGFGVMREGLYQGLFADDQKQPPTEPAKIASEALREAKRPARRAAVEDYLARYTAAGVRVVLCPMFTLADRPGFTAYFQWIGELAKRFPLQAVELHNEPNLKHFWGGTPGDYALACRTATPLIKQASPTTPVVIGSISHLWWGPGITWLKTVLATGVLDLVDGISVHPYRMKSAPEGGALHEPEQNPVGFERELAAFWGLVQGYNKQNRPLGLYLTEYGFSTGAQGAVQAGQTAGVDGVARQADYLSRSMLLFTEMRLRGLPIEGIYWYDLKCDGEDPANLEHNFGVVSRDTSVLLPSYTSYRAIAKAFGALHDFAALDLPLQVAVGSGVPVADAAHGKTVEGGATTSTAIAVVAAGAGGLPEHSAAVKSFAWRRLSDGALILSFWRLNQAPVADVDFTATLSWPLPPGFTAGKVLLHDLHGAAGETISAIPVAGDATHVSAAVPVSSRAAWLEVLPATATALQWTGTWSSTLPATFSATGNVRVTIDTARTIAAGAVPQLSIQIDNRAGSTAFAGRLCRPDGEAELEAAAGELRTVQVETRAPASDQQSSIGSYVLVQSGTVFGRGGYTVLVAPSPKSGVAPAGTAAP